MSNKPKMSFKFEHGRIISPSDDSLSPQEVVEILDHYFVIQDELSEANKKLEEYKNACLKWQESAKKSNELVGIAVEALKAIESRSEMEASDYSENVKEIASEALKKITQ